MKLMYNVSDPLHNALLQRYVWAVIPLALSTVLAQYLWARHAARAILWGIPIVAGYVGSLLLFADTPERIIGCLGIGGTLVMGWFTICVVRVFQSKLEPSQAPPPSRP